MPSASVPPPSAAGVLTAENKEDPEVVLRALSWAVIVWSVAQLVVFSFGRDQGIYAVVAEGILEGKVPYLDRWDFKPPGIFFVYAGSFLLFGKTMMAPRLVEAMLLIGGVLGLRRLGETFFWGRTAGTMAGALYAFTHSQLDFWHTGQPESFAGPLTIYAMVLSTQTWSRRREWYAWAGAGILFGCAFLLKPPFGGGAAACAYFLAAERRSHGRGWFSSLAPFFCMALSALVPIVLCLAWFAARGGLPALSWTLLEFAPGYTALNWNDMPAGSLLHRSLTDGFFGLSSLLAMGTIAAASIHPRAEREREGLLLVLGVLAFQFIGITIQAKFFEYHFGASIPLISLIAGAGYYKLWKRLGPGLISPTVALTVFLAVAAMMHAPVNDTPLGFWSRSGLRMRHLLSAGRSISREELDEKIHYVAGYNLSVAREVAYEVKRYLQPGDFVYVWGFEPVIYFLSGAEPSSRYIYNVAQRASWGSEEARRRLYEDLAEHPPRVVVTQRLDVMPFVTGTNLDSTDSLPQFPRLNAWLESNYEQAEEVDRFAIWLPRTKDIQGP